MDLKKDPTGFNYKRIAINIYQELLTTKILEKIWPSSESKSKPITNNDFSESFFEKIAQKEFETSIYNQMSCSTILSSYYQQIVNDEKTTFVNRFSSTSSFSTNNTSKNLNANLKNPLLSPQISNNSPKKDHKHLSLNIFDFGKYIVMTEVNFIQIKICKNYTSLFTKYGTTIPCISFD